MITKNSMERIKRSVIRSENTPMGLPGRGMPQMTNRLPDTEWAYNTTGYELKAGYIVAVSDYDPDTNKYTISRPSADDMPNIAVVATDCDNSSTAKVNLVFSGSVYLWYSGTAPTVSNTVGSKANSFECKIDGTTFAPLETGATVGGYGRCRSRFFHKREGCDCAMLTVNVAYISVGGPFPVDIPPESTQVVINNINDVQAWIEDNISFSGYNIYIQGTHELINDIFINIYDKRVSIFGYDALVKLNEKISQQGWLGSVHGGSCTKNVSFECIVDSYTNGDIIKTFAYGFCNCTFGIDFNASDHFLYFEIGNIDTCTINTEIGELNGAVEFKIGAVNNSLINTSSYCLNDEGVSQITGSISTIEKSIINTIINSENINRASPSVVSLSYGRINNSDISHTIRSYGDSNSESHSINIQYSLISKSTITEAIDCNSKYFNIIFGYGISTSFSATRNKNPDFYISGNPALLSEFPAYRFKECQNSNYFSTLNQIIDNSIYIDTVIGDDLNSGLSFSDPIKSIGIWNGYLVANINLKGSGKIDLSNRIDGDSFLYKIKGYDSPTVEIIGDYNRLTELETLDVSVFSVVTGFINVNYVTCNGSFVDCQNIQNSSATQLFNFCDGITNCHVDGAIRNSTLIDSVTFSPQSYAGLLNCSAIINLSISRWIDTCDNIMDCTVFDTAGIYRSNNLLNCISNNNIYGFYQCNDLDTCSANNNSNCGFKLCTNFINCTESGNGGTDCDDVNA